MNDSWLEAPTPDQIASRQFQEQLYEMVAEELKSGIRREGLWVRAYADAQGDEVQTRVLYIRYRAQSIIDESYSHHAQEKAQAAQAQANAKAQAEFLKRLPSMIQDLHRAAEYGDCVLIAKMLGAGVDVNVKRDDGNTALYLAALNGKEDAVVCLLSNGADPIIKNKKGRTPGDAARVAGYESVAKRIEGYQKSDCLERKR